MRGSRTCNTWCHTICCHVQGRGRLVCVQHAAGVSVGQAGSQARAARCEYGDSCRCDGGRRAGRTIIRSAVDQLHSRARHKSHATHRRYQIQQSHQWMRPQARTETAAAHVHLQAQARSGSAATQPPYTHFRSRTLPTSLSLSSLCKKRCAASSRPTFIAAAMRWLVSDAFTHASIGVCYTEHSMVWRMTWSAKRS